MVFTFVSIICYYCSAPVGERSIAISLSLCVWGYVCVCMSVCPRAYLWNHWTDLHKICCADPCGHGSVLLWRRCDTLPASGFMDDVAFGRNGPYADSWLPALWYPGRVWCLWMPCFRRVLVVVNKKCTNCMQSWQMCNMWLLGLHRTCRCSAMRSMTRWKVQEHATTVLIWSLPMTWWASRTHVHNV